MRGPDEVNALGISDFCRALDRVAQSRVVSLTNICQEAQLSERDIVALTFDDGFADNLDVVRPILTERQFPATFFFSTSFLKGGIPFEYQLWAALVGLGRADEYNELRNRAKPWSPSKRSELIKQLSGARRQNGMPRMLGSDSLRELAGDSLISVGSHSDNHVVLSRQTPIRLWQELKTSKQFLEQNLGYEVKWFSYPYGARNQVTDWFARAAGYKRVFSTTPCEANLDRFCISRIPLGQLVP
jgi:peptidoglycan/xylan/chitin deacetylase (PgdA/CDA1 family)